MFTIEFFSVLNGDIKTLITQLSADSDFDVRYFAEEAKTGESGFRFGTFVDYGAVFLQSQYAISILPKIYVYHFRPRIVIVDGNSNITSVFRIISLF